MVIVTLNDTAGPPTRLGGGACGPAVCRSMVAITPSAVYVVTLAGSHATVAAHVASGVGRTPLSAEAFAMSAL